MTRMKMLDALRGSLHRSNHFAVHHVIRSSNVEVAHFDLASDQFNAIQLLCPINQRSISARPDIFQNASHRFFRVQIFAKGGDGAPAHFLGHHDLIERRALEQRVERRLHVYNF